MKRAASVLTLVLVMVMILSQCAFASGLEVTKVSPKDGEGGKQVSNMCIKVSFNEKMFDESTINANAEKITVEDSEGNQIPFTVVCSEEKYPDQLWIVLNQDLVSDQEYKVTVKSGVKSAAGSTLGSDFVSTFKTRNTKIDGLISTGLMVAMMVFMFSATKKATENAAQKDEKAEVSYEEMNPYKYAKENGISVDEAKKIIQEKREKQAKAAAKKSAAKKQKTEEMEAEVAAQQARLEAEYEAARRANNYRVKKSGSVVERGIECPRSVVKHNKQKRAAAKAAAKKAAKAKKK